MSIKSRKASENELEECRFMLLTQSLDMIPKVTSNFSIVPLSNTNKFHSTTEEISDILKLKVIDVKEEMHIVIREKKTEKQKWIRMTLALRRELAHYIEGKEDHEYLFGSRQGVNRPIWHIRY